MRRAFCSLLILLAVIGLSCGKAHAQRMGLTQLVVDNQEGRIKVRFGVDIKSADVIREALENGQTLALECKASLSLKRSYAWNSEISHASLLSRMTLKPGGPFEIQHPGGRHEHFLGKDLGILMKEAWGTMFIDLGGWDQLARGNTYSVTLELRLVREDVSSLLKGALFFWNFDAISPVKYQLDFSY